MINHKLAIKNLKHHLPRGAICMKYLASSMIRETSYKPDIVKEAYRDKTMF
jgi:hypothetical protein